MVVERIVSDLSGKEIAPGRAWTMTLTPPDGRKNPVRLDITEDEAQKWLGLGTEVKRRGRRPGTAARTRTTAAAKAAGTRSRKSAAKKSATTRRRRSGGRKAAATRRKTARA